MAIIRTTELVETKKSRYPLFLQGGLVWTAFQLLQEKRILTYEVYAVILLDFIRDSSNLIQFLHVVVPEKKPLKTC